MPTNAADTVHYAEAVRPFLVDIDSLSPWPDNPRRGDLNALVDSIKTNGFYTVIGYQASTGRIVAGNHRWMALKQLGAVQVPAAPLDVNDEEATRIVLGDNRTSDLAFYDDPTLFKLLDALDGDYSGTGYDKASYELLLQGMEADSIVGGVRQGQVPGERLDAYTELDIRSIILPYEGSLYDDIAKALAVIRGIMGVDTNADVIEQLLRRTMETVDSDHPWSQ